MRHEGNNEFQLACVHDNLVRYVLDSISLAGGGGEVYAGEIGLGGRVCLGFCGCNVGAIVTCQRRAGSDGDEPELGVA